MIQRLGRLRLRRVWALENTQLAVLDAIDARAYADDLAKAATS